MTGPWRCRAHVPWLPKPERCGEPAMPMSRYCAEHYIERVGGERHEARLVEVTPQTPAPGRGSPDTSPAPVHHK